MRLFVALELPSDVADALDAAAAPLREAEPTLAWVPRDKLHLTLKFLGDVNDLSADALRLAADAVVARHRPFEMQLGDVGAFPNFRRARVVWIGVEREPRLELLHHDVEVACADLGYEVEGRPFHPHITLARVKTPLSVERARALSRSARRVTWTATVDVERLSLIESTLAPTGASYRRLHAASLGGS